MMRAIGLLVAVILLLGGSACGAFLPTMAPAAADRPQLWVNVINRSDSGAGVSFSGMTGGRSSTASVDVPACFGGAWNFPVEEAWALKVNGQQVVEDADSNFHSPTDLVATVEIAPDGEVSLTPLEPGDRPADTGDVCSRTTA